MNIDNGSDAPLISDSLHSKWSSIWQKRERGCNTVEIRNAKVQVHKIMEEPRG